MERMYYHIDEDSARQAHQMMSFSDYREGSKTAEYRHYVDEAYDLADQVAEKHPDSAEKAYHLAGSYSRKMADNLNQSSRIGCMCPSVMISGPANFPVKKKQRQNDADDNNRREFMELQGYLEKIRNLLYGHDVIASDDEQAVEKLENKLQELTKTQEHMKVVNAYYRKNGTFEGCPDCDAREARKLTANMNMDYRIDKKPFPSWQLTNNNQNMQRIKKRIETLREEKDRETTETEFKYFRVVENTDLMRLQIFFDDKPEQEVRDILKSYGFRWAPSQEAWQRQLTGNARFALQQIVKKLDELEEA